MSDHYLLLKWGTLKGWNLPEEGECFELLKKYFAEGVPMSAMADRPEEERKKILCELINKFDGPITNDWSGEEYTKEQAINYIMNYGKE